MQMRRLPIKLSPPKAKAGHGWACSALARVKW